MSLPDEVYALSLSVKIARTRELLDRSLPVFILVDPLLGEPRTPLLITADSGNAEAVRCARWNRPIKPIRLPESISLPQDQHPYLVALDGIDDPLIDFSVELALAEHARSIANGLDGNGGAVHRIGGWLQSTQSASQLASDVAAMCKVDTEAVTSARYLRVIDRRTLAFLVHALGTDRVTSSFGALSRWCYLDTHGEPAKLDNPSAQYSGLRITRQEWQLLKQGEEIHRTLARWVGEQALLDAPAERLDSNQLYRAAIDALKRARKLGARFPHRFMSMADLTTWAALSMSYPQIDKSGNVLKSLADVGPADQPASPLHEIHRDLLVIYGAESNSGSFNELRPYGAPE